MRKIVLLIPLLLFLSVGFSVQTYGENLIQNGNFSGNADGWLGFGFNNCTDSDFGEIQNGYYSEVISECQQEYANASTACGGLDTGSYGVDRGPNSFSDPDNAIDGDWSTFSGINADGNLMINYTKPSFAVNATWTIKDETGTHNISLPSFCLNSSQVGIWILGRNYGTLSAYCNQGGAYGDLLAYYLFYQSPGIDAVNFYEENITWLHSTNETFYINQSSSLDGGYVATPKFNITQGKTYLLQFDFLPVNDSHPLDAYGTYYNKNYYEVQIVPIYDGNDGCLWHSTQIDYNSSFANASHLYPAYNQDDFSNMIVSDLGDGWKRLTALWNSSKPINAEAGTHPAILTWSNFWYEENNQQNLEYIDNVMFYEVEAAPNITAFNANLTSGIDSLAVSFNGSASDINGENLTYTLFFDESNRTLNVSGNISDVQTVLGNHTYGVGSFTALLEVSDGQNQTNSTILISVNATPAAAVTINAVSGGGSGNCYYNWTCSEWAPAKCPASGKQTRQCVNKGTCSGTSGKPSESQSCEYTSPIPKQLLDVELSLENNALSNSSDLVAVVNFESFGKEPANISTTYRVFDKAGEALYTSHGRVIVYTEKMETVYFKDLKLPGGDYDLELEINYFNVTEKFEQKFSVIESGSLVEASTEALNIPGMILVVIAALGLAGIIYRIRPPSGRAPLEPSLMETEEAYPLPPLR